MLQVLPVKEYCKAGVRGPVVHVTSFCIQAPGVVANPFKAYDQADGPYELLQIVHTDKTASAIHKALEQYFSHVALYCSVKPTDARPCPRWLLPDFFITDQCDTLLDAICRLCNTMK